MPPASQRNTIFQLIFRVLATGTPLITPDSPGIRERSSPDMAGV